MKDLTDEVVAFRKLSYDDQEKSVAKDSLKEAEAETGKSFKLSELPDALLKTGKARVFNDADLLD